MINIAKGYHCSNDLLLKINEVKELLRKIKNGK